MDTHTDAKIRKAMRDFIPDTTKIIIAQRVASMEEATPVLKFALSLDKAAGAR